MPTFTVRLEDAVSYSHVVSVEVEAADETSAEAEALAHATELVSVADDDAWDEKQTASPPWSVRDVFTNEA